MFFSKRVEEHKHIEMEQTFGAKMCFIKKYTKLITALTCIPSYCKQIMQTINVIYLEIPKLCRKMNI